MQVIKVIIVEPEKEPYVLEIVESLKNLQHIVGGLIEYVNLEDKVDLICNEEGKINNLPFNRIVGNDVIAGTFIIAGVNYKTGEITSLTKEQIKKYLESFSLKNHQKQIEYMNSEFIETGNLAYMKFISLDKTKQKGN